VDGLLGPYGYLAATQLVEKVDEHGQDR
jgi:hypothetical protein